MAAFILPSMNVNVWCSYYTGKSFLVVWLSGKPGLWWSIYNATCVHDMVPLLVVPGYPRHKLYTYWWPTLVYMWLIASVIMYRDRDSDSELLCLSFCWNDACIQQWWVTHKCCIHECIMPIQRGCYTPLGWNKLESWGSSSPYLGKALCSSNNQYDFHWCQDNRGSVREN